MLVIFPSTYLVVHSFDVRNIHIVGRGTYILILFAGENINANHVNL